MDRVKELMVVRSTRKDLQLLSASAPSVTVGICAYNEEKNIGQLLHAIRSVTLVAEIIVVSSGSTDRTDSIVSEKARNDPRIRLLQEAVRAGKAKAVNTLIDSCRSDVLVFVSADTLPANGSIPRIVQWFEDPTVGAVSARPVPVNPKKGFGYVAHIMWSAHWRFLWNLALSKKLAHVSGEMCAFSAKALRPIPQDIINEDAFIAATLTKKGFRAVLDRECIVYMKAPTNVPELIDQRRRIAAGHRQIVQRTGRIPTVFASSWRIYPFEAALTILGVFREFRIRTWLCALVLLICEVVAQLLAFGVFGQSEHVLWKPLKTTKSLKT